MPNGSLHDRAQGLADEITALLGDMRDAVDKADPEGVRTEMRVYLAYALRLAVNTEILKREPADMSRVRDRVAHLVSFPTTLNYRAEGQPPATPEEDYIERTARLYGLAWAVFDRDRFLKNADLLRNRFIANGIDLDFLRGSTCLDFGCGTGRNCLALARLGAEKVLGVDLSQGCIDTARSNLAHYAEYERIELATANVFDYFEGQSELFDFVVAQGVFMTMPSPAEAARLVNRVLKPGGRFFVYFFGESESGIIWDVAETYRHLLKPVPIEITRDMLLNLGANQGDIFNLLDFAYVPHQHHWPRAQFEETLTDAGFSEVSPMLRGEDYDAHQRILLYPWERDFWGDFDLRYLCVK